MFSHSMQSPDAFARKPRRRSQWLSVASLGLGAALMYFLDPDKGGRRRANLRRRLVRGAGLWAQISRWAKVIATRGAQPSADELLAERVRAKLGRLVSHPHALRAFVQGGVITLSGPIVASEANRLFAALRDMRGARAIDNRLEVLGDDVSAAHGGAPLRGRLFELMQADGSPAARVATGALGAGCLAYAMWARRPPPWVLGLIGCALLLRALDHRDRRHLVRLDGPANGLIETDQGPSDGAAPPPDSARPLIGG